MLQNGVTSSLQAHHGQSRECMPQTAIAIIKQEPLFLILRFIPCEHERIEGITLSCGCRAGARRRRCRGISDQALL